MKPKRVLLVDDHTLFREGLAGIINAQPDFEVVGEAADGLEAIVMTRQLEPDLILMDIQMPGYDGLEATRQIMRELPESIIIILTVREDDEKLFQALKSGAKGYLLKNIRSQEMLAMIRGAMQGAAALPAHLTGRVLEEFRRLSKQVPADFGGGNPVLTSRESEVLVLVAQGKTDKEIADALTISKHTVKSHIRNILAKLQVGSRREAAFLAHQKDLL